MNVRNIEELDTIDIYGEEDKDCLTIFWNEIIQIEMTLQNFYEEYHRSQVVVYVGAVSSV